MAQMCLAVGVVILKYPLLQAAETQEELVPQSMAWKKYPALLRIPEL